MSVTTADETEARRKLASRIPYFGFWTIGVLGTVILVGAAIISYRKPAGDTAFLEAGKYVLGVLLPVISAWVGTIIAFYFGREHYETAVQGTKALVRELSMAERLESISAKSVMLLMEDPDTKKLALSKTEDQYKITPEVMNKMAGKNRLPILSSTGAVKYMAHKSVFDEFLVHWVKAGNKQGEATLKDLLDDRGYGEQLRNGFEVVALTATLAEVKERITPVVSDVFLTAGGDRASKAIGWITNVIVTDNSLAMQKS